MTTYTAIVNSEIDTDSPITESLMTRLRDNPIAIATGATGAPRMQTGALEQTGGSEAVTAATIRANTITQTEIGSNAVGVDELKTTTSVQSTSVPASSTKFIILTGGFQTISAQTRWDTAAATGSFITVISGSTGTSYLTQARLVSTSTLTLIGYVNSKYVQASPPYDLGDGAFDFFLQACIAPNGDLLGIYAAPDPVWINNGSKRLPVTRKEKKQNGEVLLYTTRKDMSSHGLSWDIAKKNEGTMNAYIHAFKDAPEVETPITPAMKNENMVEIPHSFDNLLSDVPGSKIVMLDPFSVFIEDFKAMLDHDDFDIQDIEGYIDFNAPDSNFIAPPGVNAIEARFK